MNDLHEQATHIHTMNCQLMDDFAELKEEIEEFNANHKRPAASGENENGQANGTSGLGGCVSSYILDRSLYFLRSITLNVNC